MTYFFLHWIIANGILFSKVVADGCSLRKWTHTPWNVSCISCDNLPWFIKGAMTFHWRVEGRRSFNSSKRAWEFGSKLSATEDKKPGVARLALWPVSGDGNVRGQPATRPSSWPGKPKKDVKLLAGSNGPPTLLLPGKWDGRLYLPASSPLIEWLAELIWKLGWPK